MILFYDTGGGGGEGGGVVNVTSRTLTLIF